MSGEPGIEPVPRREALRVWCKLGLLSFGGPAGQIALMHRLLVDERKWIDEGRFLHALNFCMLLPGPEAMQLATYLGWLFHGWRGGLLAGLLFVIPGALAVLALAAVYAAFGEAVVLEAVFFGVKTAVLAIVLQALLRIARRALRSRRDWGLAGGAFLAIVVFDAPFPLVVLVAAGSACSRERTATGPLCRGPPRLAEGSRFRARFRPPPSGSSSGSARWPC